jgi:hypothetical protein
MIIKVKKHYTYIELKNTPLEEVEKLFQNGEISEIKYYDRRSQGQPPGNADRLKYLTLISAPD